MRKVAISDELYALAQAEAKLQGWSVEEQLELWARFGTVVEDRLAAVRTAVSEVDAAIARTKLMDTLDVVSGRRSPEWLHFIPPAIARQSKPVFPRKYLKS